MLFTVRPDMAKEVWAELFNCQNIYKKTFYTLDSLSEDLNRHFLSHYCPIRIMVSLQKPDMAYACCMWSANHKSNVGTEVRLPSQTAGKIETKAPSHSLTIHSTFLFDPFVKSAGFCSFVGLDCYDLKIVICFLIQSSLYWVLLCSAL